MNNSSSPSLFFLQQANTSTVISLLMQNCYRKKNVKIKYQVDNKAQHDDGSQSGKQHQHNCMYILMLAISYNISHTSQDEVCMSSSIRIILLVMGLL